MKKPKSIQEVRMSLDVLDALVTQYSKKHIQELGGSEASRTGSTFFSMREQIDAAREKLAGGTDEIESERDEAFKNSY